jgi:hypothetical protein
VCFRQQCVKGRGKGRYRKWGRSLGDSTPPAFFQGNGARPAQGAAADGARVGATSEGSAARLPKPKLVARREAQIGMQIQWCGGFSGWPAPTRSRQLRY